MTAERRETDRRAAVYEPAPTGNGEVVLTYVLERVSYIGRTAANAGLAERARYLQVIHDDLSARAEFGKKKYGTYLRTNNGRDALNDYQQENYDAIMYAAQLRRQGDIEASKWLEAHIEIAVHLCELREQRENR